MAAEQASFPPVRVQWNRAHAGLHTSRANLLFEFGKSTPSANQIISPMTNATMIAAGPASGFGAIQLVFTVDKSAPPTTLSIAIN